MVPSLFYLHLFRCEGGLSEHDGGLEGVGFGVRAEGFLADSDAEGEDGGEVMRPGLGEEVKVVGWVSRRSGGFVEVWWWPAGVVMVVKGMRRGVERG